MELAPTNLPWLGLSDPFAALTHLLAAAAAAWATLHLWLRTTGVPWRRVSVLVFAASSIALFLASGTYHAAFEPWKAALRRVDHAAIYVLIAGTFTPLVAHLMHGPWRARLLGAVWTMAAAGVGLKLFLFGALPEWIDISLYLAMGWFGLVPAVPIIRARRYDVVGWMALGGLFYTAGALCELFRWPVLLPGVLGAHEVFHLAVILGSASFLLLILRHVVPSTVALAPPARPLAAGATLRERIAPGRFLRVGHRGARGLAPENTLAGFRRAVETGVDMVELDVQLSRDGEVVVIHDLTVDRTTDWAGPGPGVVTALTYEELARLDAGHAFTPDGGQTFPYRGQGVRIPRLAEVLEAFPDLLFTIELKSSCPELVAKTVDLVRRLAPERAVLASAEHAALRALRRAAPELVTSFSGREVRDFYLLSRVGLAGLLFRSPALLIQTPMWSDHDHDRGLRMVTPGVLRAAHTSGRAVHVWTVNDVATMRALIALGVDGITTDRPDLLAQVWKP
jgi:glycerophosphoryl diester phosphodiesterase